MRSRYKIDKVDKQILQFLIQNTRMPFTEIAKRMEVSAGTIHVRVKKLEDAGIIKGSSLEIDYERLGYNFIAYIGIMLTKSSHTKSVIAQLEKIPNVTVANIISGRYNIFCKIRAKDTNDARDVIFKIDEIEEVSRTESMISLDEIIDDRSRLLTNIFM
ncbi:Regulatory protein AsnC [Candidatus Ornithobacterium hominis]|uniref:Regulatory protein AsnC n=1 Tax=Candidatus Ornithobacterium hominis TaxID=2497989 RepID=A0A383TWQ7_9FLAO|nr:winged helix-turn-helix transcriptional regulator [Candidatus Ornithobacterium hominis]MCT7904828.1 winged helix-turn-helix transcriptional regulator [Candidatus Ornithobacterium hominis]SZD71599.1 Regulatory protein AsnC [Candidatus Ornithobacterium hominis]